MKIKEISKTKLKMLAIDLVINIIMLLLSVAMICGLNLFYGVIFTGIWCFMIRMNINEIKEEISNIKEQ